MIHTDFVNSEAFCVQKVRLKANYKYHWLYLLEFPQNCHFNPDETVTLRFHKKIYHVKIVYSLGWYFCQPLYLAVRFSGWKNVKHINATPVETIPSNTDLNKLKEHKIYKMR